MDGDAAVAADTPMPMLIAAEAAAVSGDEPVAHADVDMSNLAEEEHAEHGDKSEMHPSANGARVWGFNPLLNSCTESNFSCL